MQNLRFAIAAGETKIFELAGRYLEIIEAAGPLTIELYDTNGGQSDEARDVLSGTYMTEPFARIAIFSATAQTVELFLSARGGGTKRQPGTVNVIDSNKTRTVANQAFTVTAARAAAGAGQYGRCGLWNPPGSGRRMVIDKITYATNGAASTWYIGFQNTGAGLLGAAKSKLAGGADSAFGQITQDNTGTNANLSSVLISIPGTTGQIKFDTPVVLMPGFSFVATHSTANQDVFLTVEFVEETN